MKKNTKRCLCAFLVFTTLLSPSLMGCTSKTEKSNPTKEDDSLATSETKDISYYVNDRAIIKIGNDCYVFKIKYSNFINGNLVTVTFEDGTIRTISSENFWPYNSHDNTMNSIVEEQKIMKK